MTEKKKEPERTGNRGTVPEVLRNWIVEHQKELSPEDMAEQKGIKLSTVQKILDKHLKVVEPNQYIIQALKKSTLFKQAKREFDELELEYLVEKYAALMEQFREDCLPTEQQQVFNIIRIEILMHRNLKARRDIRLNVERVEALRDAILARYEHDISQVPMEQQERLASLQEQVTETLRAETSRNSEFINLQKEHNSLTDELKASRSQRIKNIENIKVSFTGLVKQLQERDLQVKESRNIELGVLAMANELQRLGKPHLYEDNILDQPILTSETLDFQEEENEG